MNETQIKEEIKKLEELRDAASDIKDKDFYESLIKQKKEQLRELENENYTQGQEIGSTVGRLGGNIVGLVMGVVDDCLTGNTNQKVTKRTRAKYADGGEKVGAAIGGVAEKLIKKIRSSK